MSWANYLFEGLREKSGSVTRLAANTDAEIMERISESVTSYTTESNENTFKPDTVFDSFHHHAKTFISDRALLAGFLMLWLKKCVVPTLSHEVIAVDVAYPAILLAYGRSLGLLPAMVAVFRVNYECCAKVSATWWLKKIRRATSSLTGMVNQS